MAPDGINGHTAMSLTNYCVYLDNNTQTERIGSLDLSSNNIQPLAFASGTPLSSLYEVIEAGEDGIIALGDRVSRSEVALHAPIGGRDILCVGKNYAEHAKEFNSSGFDSSDKVDQPTHPVIFTKRFTSIIGDGEDIYPHPEFTKSLDYEGELGVIIGKPGFRIKESEAMAYVWGYTIINDVTARERQRDHKQFYIGKSPDTFCPMGPIAVPASKLDKVLQVRTHVNGEERQNATTEQLIFSIPLLIMTLSEGQTLMPGDVLATGTPAGVGIGRNPPIYLQSGDEVTVSITGLGSLTNRIASPSSQNPTLQRIQSETPVKATNSVKTFGGTAGLTTINSKPTNLVKLGEAAGDAVVFVHGLGGSVDFWTPLIKSAGLESSHSMYLFDFEGHGLSPTSPRSKLSISSLAADVRGVFDHARIKSGSTLIAHSMGCLIALSFVLANPGLVKKLVLLGPPPSPLPQAGSDGSHARAASVRQKGMAGVVDAVAKAGTSSATQQSNPLAYTAARLSLLGQDPEGYAKACTALAEATDTLDISKVDADILIITGSEDRVSPATLCGEYAKKAGSKAQGPVVLANVGHWHVFEDATGVANAVKAFI